MDRVTGPGVGRSGDLALAYLLTLILAGDAGPGAFRPRRDRCAECGAAVGPGRAGRRCEPCRAARSTGG